MKGLATVIQTSTLACQVVSTHLSISKHGVELIPITWRLRTQYRRVSDTHRLDKVLHDNLTPTDRSPCRRQLQLQATAIVSLLFYVSFSCLQSWLRRRQLLCLGFEPSLHFANRRCISSTISASSNSNATFNSTSFTLVFFASNYPVVTSHSLPFHCFSSVTDRRSST